LIVIRPQPAFGTPFDTRGLKVHFGTASIAAEIAIGCPDFAQAHSTLPLISNRISMTTIPERLRPFSRPDGLSGWIWSACSRISLVLRQTTSSDRPEFPQLQQGTEGTCAASSPAAKSTMNETLRGNDITVGRPRPRICSRAPAPCLPAGPAKWPLALPDTGRRRAAPLPAGPRR
jgi:hypothetical protein